MAEFVGRIDSVFTRQFSASIGTPAASAGATSLTVVDGDDLDPSGQVLAPWDGTVYAYTFDGDVTVTLSTPLATAADSGELLVVWDPAKSAPVVDTVAHVAVLGVDSAEDVIEARVSFPLIPMLPEGIRTEDTAEAVTVRLDGSDYVVAEVLGQAALIDGAMIDPDTVPPAATDGLAPGSNPTVTLRPGIGSLFVVWEPVDNADPVSYDVYAVPAADAARLAYPPLATDLVGTSDGTGAGFRALPDGTTLTPAGSYAVAVYARDKDGTCTTSATPVIGSPAQVNSQDLALNALTADHLTANSALFIALQVEDIVGVNITGSTITGSTVVGTTIKTADTGNYWRLGSDGVSARIEAVHDFATGPVDETAGLWNIAAESGTTQVLGTSIGSGGLVPWYVSQGSLSTQLTRTRPTTSDPWGPQVSKTYLYGHEIGIYGQIGESGDTTPSKITIEARGAGGQVIISGQSITIGGQTIEDTGWINIPLVSGFTAQSGETPQYKRRNGVIYLRGRVNGSFTTSAQTIGNLPAGFRPGQDNAMWATFLGGGTVYARCWVESGGAVRINAASAGTGAVSVLGDFAL